MFFYFGYGSNLDTISLQAKGVRPVRSEPAILSNWRLTFDVANFFTIEGGTGNIQPHEGGEVHGVLHRCRDPDLAVLDELEALGVAYERIESEFTTYRGRKVRGYVYVGLPEGLAPPDSLPSERYRNILVRGAEAMKLDPAYVQALREQPTCPRPANPPFVFPEEPDRIYSLAELAASPSLTGLFGAVFDMSGAPRRHDYLRRVLGGKEVTLLFLKRLDTSDGTETFDDVREGRLSDAQLAYLNDYLHEFAREYRYAGRMRYARSTHELVNLSGAARKRMSTSTVVLDPARKGGRVPARRVLVHATETNERLGHENLGFLSAHRGFMPTRSPLLELSPSHRAWDEVVAELPTLYRDLRVRQAMHDLPLLSGDADHLPDAEVLRAASVLAMLSHAYWYCNVHPPQELPTGLTAPWEQVRRRLGRGVPVLSYIDLIVYNWRFVDPDAADPFALSNLRLAIPTVGNKEEETFYLTQVEILARCGPIIGAIARAQEAVAREDEDALEVELLGIMGCLQKVVRTSLMNINPNPSAPTFMDPVIWAKTVAPFAVPMEEGVQGPSGTSSPIFNALDGFFGRQKYKTFLGKEIHALRNTYPPHWRDYLYAINEISIAEFVRRVDKPALSGLFQDAFDVYAGSNGFLGRHRLKVYGYLELAFKVGRSVTIGGFSGLFKDRTWDQVDSELEYSRQERLERFPRLCHHGRIASVGPTHPGGADDVRRVEIDVVGTGVRFSPGDRCGVLPANADTLVNRTLRALGATGDERLPVTKEWAAALNLRPGDYGGDTLALRDLLRFGRIRPVVPRVAEALHALTQNDTLQEALVAHASHQWELWDLIALLQEFGLDPARLFDASRDDFENLGQIVPPEGFRMYSITRAMGAAAAERIVLTVRRIHYDDDGIERAGTASNYLASAEPGDPVAFIVEHPPRFSLPEDPSVPLVMIAGGTGLSPFIGFLEARLSDPDAADCWLLVGARDRSHLYYEPQLAAHVATGRLRLSVAYSRDADDARRLDELVEDPVVAADLWTALQRGSLYVCGRSRLATTVQEALVRVVGEHGGTDEGQARAHLDRMMAEGRYLLETFTDPRGVDPLEPVFDVSEISRHNNPVEGYWTVIDGAVYDLTQFVRSHPGGTRVLQGYAGIDATQGYLRSHQGKTEVHAMREMYRIGMVRPLDFGGVTAIWENGSHPRVIALAALYRAWVGQLYLLVEMQNALRADQSLQFGVTTRDDPAEPRSYYKLERAAETHARFVTSYVDWLGSDSLARLWRLTTGLCAPDERNDVFVGRFASARNGSSGRFVTGVTGAIEEGLRTVVAEGSGPGELLYDRVLDACQVVEEADERLLVELTRILRRGVVVFEKYLHDTLDYGGQSLIDCCRDMGRSVRLWQREIRQTLGSLSLHPEDLPEDPDTSEFSEIIRRKVVAETPMFRMEEDLIGGFVYLKRTAAPVPDLETLVREIDEMLDAILPVYVEFGLVADFRDAPPRNDPAFEKTMGKLRAGLTSGFARLALLVETEAGKLQGSRISRNENQTYIVTQSEDEAIRFAAGRR